MMTGMYGVTAIAMSVALGYCIGVKVVSFLNMLGL